MEHPGDLVTEISLLKEQNKILSEENFTLKSQLFQFEQELDFLKRQLFGRKSERYIPVDDAQLKLSLEGVEQKQKTAQLQEIKYKRQKPAADNKQPVRLELPAHLRREEEVIEPEVDLNGAKRIGEVVTEILEYTPGELHVKKYIRPKYVLSADQGIVIGELPSMPLPKSNAGASLLTHIIISKFVDHLPFYRQIQQFRRQGVTIAESTINGWFNGVGDLLEPLYERLRQQVVQCDYLQTDETPIQVQDPVKRGKTHRGYYWVYHSPIKKLICFDYQEGRSRAGPARFLKDFKGMIQVDGYKAYDIFDDTARTRLLGCMAHARRKFEKSLKSKKEWAEQALEKFRMLYMIERKAAGMSYGQRKELREKESLPVLEGMRSWMEEKYQDALPKSAINLALSYSLNSWVRLTRYLEDGRYEIDNNWVENAIRPVAVGRKNYLFAGSHDAARRAAIIYSLLNTCKKNNINPATWLNDILCRITDYPVNQLENLLPNKWTGQKPG
jgi:transposase